MKGRNGVSTIQIGETLSRPLYQLWTPLTIVCINQVKTRGLNSFNNRVLSILPWDFWVLVWWFLCHQLRCLDKVSPRTPRLCSLLTGYYLYCWPSPINILPGTLYWWCKQATIKTFQAINYLITQVTWHGSPKCPTLVFYPKCCWNIDFRTGLYNYKFNI